MINKLNFKQSFMAGSMAAGAATIINTVLFFIFHGMGIITDDIFVQPNEPLTATPIIFASILPTLVASVVFFLFEKFSKQEVSFDYYLCVFNKFFVNETSLRMRNMESS